MNRNRRTVFFRIMATIMCAACVVVMCSGYQARAETTADFPIAKNGNQLLQAIAAADDGDTIGISDMIAFYEGVTIGAEDKRITIVRMNENAFLSFTGSDSSLVQNVVFDGGNIESNYPMISSQCSLTVENSIFQNCICNGEGAALGFYSDELNIASCVFKDNWAYRGGHVYIATLREATISSCTFKNGEAKEQGGALYVTGETKIRNSVITNNRANYGGGIYHGSQNCIISGTKIYYNSANIYGSDYATETPYFYFAESVAELTELFAPDNLKPVEWEISNNSGVDGFKLILETLTPIEPEQPTTPEKPETPTEPENPDEPDKPTEPENPENPENPNQPDTPTELGENEPPKDESGTGTDKPAEGENKPSEPETPPDDTQNKGDEQPPADNPEEKPGVSGSGNAPESPSDSTGNNGGNNTSNSTSTTTTSDNRTTDNSDNSRYSSTSDSNNTSTVNNYYQQEKQPSSSGESVQTIVVPVGNTGNGEPLQQTIRVESPEGTTATGSLEGLTLNINVNTASQDQAANTSPVQQSGISWYQAIVLCLLSAILVCLLKSR